MNPKTLLILAFIAGGIYYSYSLGQTTANSTTVTNTIPVQAETKPKENPPANEAKENSQQEATQVETKSQAKLPEVKITPTKKGGKNLDFLEAEKNKMFKQSATQTKAPEAPTKPQDDLTEGNFVGSLEELDKPQGNNVGEAKNGVSNDMKTIQDSCTTGDEYCGQDRNSHTASNEAKGGSRTPDINLNKN